MTEETLLRLPQVEAITGLKHTAIYLKMKRGEFPRPVYLGRQVRWPHSEVLQWMETLKASRSQRHREFQHL
jgi:prophage regulatory protein